MKKILHPSLLPLLVLTGAFALGGCATSAGPVDDADLTVRVKSSIGYDETLGSVQSHIKVRTENGVVHLGGIVDSHNQKTKAESDAMEVAGVKSVVNEIVVAQ